MGPPGINFLKGQFYSHAYVNAKETYKHGNPPNLFKMGGDLNARKPF